MTLKPIPGAPIGAPIPDFPNADPGPLVVPVSRFLRRSVDASPLPPPPSAAVLPARQPGPIEIHAIGAGTLTFRCIPEIPAINRSSLIISISGERTEQDSREMTARLDLPADAAKAFLLALRDADPPIVAGDSGTALHVEFAIAEDGPVFIVSKQGRTHAARRFNAGSGFDVKTMAAHLLADLGP
jgi:hypothetical protein